MTAHCEWQPIDTAPCDGTPVLLFHPAWDVLKVGIRYDETNRWQQPCGDLLRPPTHWMRLPPSPREEQVDRQPTVAQGRIATCASSATS